eukprot:2191908-Rhodomonas_salina.1
MVGRVVVFPRRACLAPCLTDLTHSSVHGTDEWVEANSTDVSVPRLGLRRTMMRRWVRLLRSDSGSEHDKARGCGRQSGRVQQPASRMTA